MLRNFARSIRNNIVDPFIIRQFHKIAYRRRIWDTTTWLGHRVLQYPGDLIVKQEVLSKVKPSLLIECGTAHGGSSLFYASIMDLLGHGRVVSIDIEVRPVPSHPRITYLIGSTTAPEIVKQIEALTPPGEPVMVVLDSLHACHHVLAELNIYHRFVTPGSYLIVEDGEMNGHPVYTIYPPEKGEGPFEAVHKFLPDHREFEVDRSAERYLVTGHVDGFLRKKQ